MSAAVEVGGHTGAWESLRGEVAVLRLPKAFAPGAPLVLRATLLVEGASREVSVPAKTVNSKRVGDDFEVTAKIHGLTRETRALVTAHFA